MKQERTLVQLSDRGQITLPADVRKALGLQGGDAFRVNVENGRIWLEPVEVVPVELYSDARVAEFLENSDMTEDELARAREAWGI